MPYYRMDWQLVPPPGVRFVVIDETPDLDLPWTMGVPYGDALPEPIRCTLSPRGGPDVPDLLLTGIPLFSDRLLAALDAAGVDNIVRYSAEIVDPNNRVHTTHKAVNIVGAVSCADLERSEFLDVLEPPLMAFTHLVIDEARAHDLPFFRLAESTLYILVAERVKRAIEAANLLGVRLTPIDR
jgi:hypothetical protein